MLRSFAWPHEAALARNALHAAGIAAVTCDENLVRIDWFLSNALGGVKLLVPARDSDAARALLDSSAEPVDPGEAADLAELERCPSCHEQAQVELYPLGGRGG